MIVRDHLPFRRVWPQVSKRLGLLFAFDLTISLLYTSGTFTAVALPTLPLGMMGAALSIFLAFRNNSAYDRWWEARTLWGALVNTARSFSRQALTLVDPDTRHEGPDRADGAPPGRAVRVLVETQIAYVHALRCHLRGQNPFPELERRLPTDLLLWLRTQRNVPVALLLDTGRQVRELYDAGRLDAYRFTAFDATLSKLCDIQGGCERIKNTPLPRQYEYFPRVLVSVYCLLLPLGLVQGLGLLTPLASTLVSFIFLSLESIGRDIEAPFENTVHDTPMSQLSRVIEINLRENLGDDAVPTEVIAVEGFVY